MINFDNKNSELWFLLGKLKKSHSIYLMANEDQRSRLFELSSPLIEKLFRLTKKDRTFFEALLVFGLEFLLAEYGDEAERLFGAFKEPI